MKNWVIQVLLYDIHPSAYRYVKSRWYHFHFCKEEDITITAALYFDNLADEIKYEIAKLTSVNKKSLVLAVIRNILENKKARQQIVALFENKHIVVNEEIKKFLDNVSTLMQDPFAQVSINQNSETHYAEFPVRAYVIATHIYLELNNNEMHYETLIRDTTALREFIIARFKAGKLSGRIADMKNFSYKRILAGKNTEGAKGQLKPQLKQIASNPEIFGTAVSSFAEKILTANF